MEIINEIQLEDKTDLIVHTIRSDLQKILCAYNDFKKGIRIVASKTGIHEKTLKRILVENRRPTYLTVFRFYRFKFNVFNDHEILKLVPEDIADYLKKSNPQTIDEKVTFSSQIDHELTTNPIFGEIYLLLGTGHVEFDEIKERFGNYGISIIEKMMSLKVAQEVRKNLFAIGPNIIHLSSKAVLFLGNHLTNSYASSTRGDLSGQNFHGLYVEGLSLEGLRQWLQIDQDAFAKKIHILKDKNFLGDNRVFTYVVTDQMKVGE